MKRLNIFILRFTRMIGVITWLISGLIIVLLLWPIMLFKKKEVTSK